MSIQLSNVECGCNMTASGFCCVCRQNEKCYECGMCGGEGHVCEDIKESIDRFIQMCKDRGMDAATAAEMMEEGYYKPLREEKERQRVLECDDCDNFDNDEEEEEVEGEYENDVLISDKYSSALCTTCNEWVQMNKFVGPDTADFDENGPSQPCYQCRQHVKPCTNTEPCHDYDECSWCSQHVKPCECGCGYLGGTCDEYNERILLEEEVCFNNEKIAQLQETLKMQNEEIAGLLLRVH